MGMTEQVIRTYLRQMQETDAQAAFRSFYDLCFERFFRIAYYYLKTDEWAQEVVLDVFMKIWEKREVLHKINNPEDYFFITIKNASLSYLAKEENRKHNREELSDNIPGRENSPEENLISEELFAHYVKALDRLPKRCREVFIRIREEKQSYAQVAKELNISINTVDAQLQKALSRLRDSLLCYLEPEEEERTGF